MLKTSFLTLGCLITAGQASASVMNLTLYGTVLSHTASYETIGGSWSDSMAPGIGQEIRLSFRYETDDVVTERGTYQDENGAMVPYLSSLASPLTPTGISIGGQMVRERVLWMESTTPVEGEVFQSFIGADSDRKDGSVQGYHASDIQSEGYSNTLEADVTLGSQLYLDFSGNGAGFQPIAFDTPQSVAFNPAFSSSALLAYSFATLEICGQFEEAETGESHYACTDDQGDPQMVFPSENHTLGFSLTGLVISGSGESEDEPVMPSPVVSGGSFIFEFDPETFVPGAPVWIDPVVAAGYDYAVTGALFDSVTMPSLGAVPDADGLYTLLFGDEIVSLGAGETYDFLTDVSAFLIRGIDTGLALDPANPLAFPTGIALAGFTGAPIIVTQTPITVDTAPVPLPAGLPLLLAGCGGLAMVRTRARRRTA